MTADPTLTEAPGMVMLDYQVIPVRGGPSIDLLGFHLFNKVNDWFYLGVGGHAPLFHGEYGGFMVFDATAHVQRRIFGDFFANAGISLGGGGGGRNVAQSAVLSGTGGFVKAYAGVGHHFKDFSVGANLSRVRFTDSAISHSQLSLFVQLPFSYTIGPYHRGGERVARSERRGVLGDRDGAGETMLSLGLDNMFQIDPQGTNKGDINNIDLQYSHFMNRHGYWFFNAGGGYRGRPLYNQAFGGLGYRYRVSPQVNLYGQLGIGSGGYAPEMIDTGPGLLVYPKLAAEYMINDNFGLSAWGGYLWAPKGSSKNYTFGVGLNYHIDYRGRGSPAGGGVLRAYRFNLFQQTEFNVEFRGDAQPDIKLLTLQFDGVVNDHLYLPVQVGVAYNPYLNLPGYGEVLAGVGVQTRYDRGDAFQVFGQLLIGANPHGGVVKTGIGFHYGLNDRLAIHALAGQTFGSLGAKDKKFRSDYLGVGLTYRFSSPNW